MLHNRLLRRVIVPHSNFIYKNRLFFSMLTQYKTKLNLDESFQEDSEQLRIVKILDKIRENIETYSVARGEYEALYAQWKVEDEERKRREKEEKKHKNGIESKSTNMNDCVDNKSHPAPSAPPLPRGMYLYGDVGTGKTMLMDMLFDSVSTKVPKKRVHFHKFCLDVHLRIHKCKQDLIKKFGRNRHIEVGDGARGLPPERDAIAQVGREIANESWLLCFDEFQVTDVADALIMSRLFEEIWKSGTVLIATSNRPPDDLYKNGLNRQYFVPFLEQLDRNCLTRSMKSFHDYRTDVKQDQEKLHYFTPVSESTTKLLFDDFKLTCGDALRENVEVKVMMGRKLIVPFASSSEVKEKGTQKNKCCFFTFEELCNTEKGAADYKALASNYRSLYLAGVPEMSILGHNKARRFITLVDELYDAKCNLYWTCDAGPLEMFKVLDVANGPGINENNETDEDTDARKKQLHALSCKLQTLSFELTSKAPTSFTNPQRDSIHNTVTQRFGSDAAEDELSLLEGEICSVQELGFAFRRASSRLLEMSRKTI